MARTGSFQIFKSDKKTRVNITAPLHCKTLVIVESLSRLKKYESFNKNSFIF